MEARFPTYIYKNPAGVMNVELFKKMGITGQVDLSSHIIASTLNFVDSILDETLEPDVFKGFPLDMLQYRRMVASNRIPNRLRDTVYSHPEPKTVRHILVTRGTNFYKLNVKSEDGTNASVLSIRNGLERIIADDRVSQPPVGVLTTQNRDAAADTRSALLDAGNEASLLDVDSALFVICLDPPIVGEETLSTGMRAAMHGNPRHRWFDKPVQIIVTNEVSGRSDFVLVCFFARCECG